MRKIIVTSALFFFTQAVSAADAKPKNPIATLETLGPIARATRLPATLVAMIAAYRGPVYKDGYLFISLANPQWFDSEQFHEAKHYFLTYENGVFDVCRVYRHKMNDMLYPLLTTFAPAIAAYEPTNLRRTDPSNNAKQFSSTNLIHIYDSKKREVLKALQCQSAITKAVRNDHGEIPIANDPEVAALTYKNMVIVATKCGKLQMWPMVTEDL